VTLMPGTAVAGRTGGRPGDPTAELTGPAPRRERRIPAAVWWITAVHVVLMALYAVLVPTFRAPDEYMHVDLALRVAEGGGYPEYYDQLLSAAVLEARDTSPAYVAFAPAATPDQAEPRDQRPPFASLAEGPTRIVNPMPQHPPLYYGLAGGLLAAVDQVVDLDDVPFDRVVGILRLLGVALLAPLPLLAWAASRHLGHGRTTGVVAAALVLCVPTLTHIGASVNNDDLLILLGAALAVLVARIARGDTSWGATLGSGYLLGLALLTKGFALVLVPCLALAFAVALVPARRWGDLARRGGVALGVAFVIGGWWWARNLVVHGVLLPGVGLRDRVPVEPDVSEFVVHYAERLLTSTWGSFGWNEAALPMPLAALASALLVAAVVVALAVRRRGDLAVLVVPAVLLAGLVTANAWRAYLKTGVPYASQGRYLFAGLVGVLVVAAAVVGLLPERARRRAPAVVLAAAAVLHLLSIGAIVGRYWSGRWLAALLAFSPWPPPVVGGLALALVAVAVAAAISVQPARAAVPSSPRRAEDRTAARSRSVIVAPHGK
jgi:hypothetical protein